MDLSIIIPTYNSKDYIASCLRGVITCPKDEIAMECIVVNDGSKDDTAEIIHRYQERDTRIVLWNKENSGVSDTRNYGLEHASGKYIMFLDADDRFCADAWEHIIPAVKKGYGDYVAFSYLTLYENGKIIPQPLPIEEVVSTEMRQARNLMYASSDFNTCWGKLFLRELIEENNIRFRSDLPIGEDFLFVAEYFAHCQSCYMSKEMTLFYLQRAGSAMRSYTMKQRLDFTKILYEYNKAAVEKYADQELNGQMEVYYLRVITNLFREYAGIYNGKQLIEIYKDALENETVKEILESVKEEQIYSKMKKLEYRLLKKKKIGILKGYFGLKAKL